MQKHNIKDYIEDTKGVFKLKTVNRAAVAIAFSSFVIAVILQIIIKIALFELIVDSMVLFFITFISAKIIISRFVLYRLKPIYELILNKDVSVNNLDDRFKGKEIFGEVSADLVKWAENKSQEIVSLKEMENYRKEFLGNVSHELKTPLFTIQGYILTMLDGGINDPAVNMKYLSSADRNLERLIAIVKDLESISHLEQKVVQLERKKLDIVALCKDLVDLSQSKAKENGIKLSVESDDVIYVFADQVRIEQVILNLLVNSIKYGKKNGRTKIKFVDMYQKILIEVEDNGIGISKEDQPRISERFYRVDKSRSRDAGGTGLGLAIVKHILEAHGSTLSLRSELGKGSTFSFTLPKYL